MMPLAFVIALICFAFPVVNAQSIEDVEVIEGSVFEIDGLIYELLPPNVGGLISSFQNQITKTLEFMGVTIHEEEIYENVPSFELMAFGVGEIPDFNQVIYGDVFAESESLIIPNRTTIENIFVTTSIDASWGDGSDAQSLKNFEVWFSSGSLIMTSIGGSTLNYRQGYDESPHSDTILVCDETFCPSSQSLEVAFGLVDGVDYNNLGHVKPNGMGRILVLQLDSGLVGFLWDENNDASWDFTSNIATGFSTISFEENSLLLTEPGFYDIYVIV